VIAHLFIHDAKELSKEAKNDIVTGRLSYDRNTHKENHIESTSMLSKFA